MGEGAQQLQCKSESAKCSEKQQSPCEGEGAKNLKKMLKKKKRHYLKQWAWFPLYFVLFHSPQPNNIGPAWQQPRALFLISLSLVGGG